MWHGCDDDDDDDQTDGEIEDLVKLWKDWIEMRNEQQLILWG